MTDETLFAAALEKPDATARAAYLDSACSDPDTRKRIDALLAAHNRAGAFLARPAVAPANPEAAPTRGFRPEAGADHTRTHGGTVDTDTDEALGFLAPPSRPDSLGRIGHYEVLEVLGRGGFGIVFRAFDEVLQRVVAVKVLAPSMAVTSPARKRFLREARSSASVRHENVVHVYAVEEQPLPYLVMEFIPGETLQQRLDRTGPLDVPEILRIGRQIALGLAAAHEMGLIHRDIKPSNILVDNGPHERVKITDFGLARAADDASISQSGVVAGTPMYMAPEQAKGDALDHRADLFSLGSVLYVMCTGRPPFRASGTLAVLKRVCEEDPRPIREVIPEMPEWLCRIIEKLHAKKPDDRFQSAKEVAEVLADCEKQLLTHARLKDHSRIPLAKTRPAGRRRVWKWTAAAAAFVLLLCGVFFGRAAMLYWNDRGEVEFANDPGWKSVTVLRDGQPVAELESVFLHPRIDLPPGRYTLKAGLSSVMDEIILWEVVDANLNGSWRSKETRNASNECIVDVKRGRRVQVRAVTRMRSQNDLNRDLDQKDLQGDWIAESIEFQNRKLSPEDCRKCRLTIKGETARLSLPDGRTVDGKFSLDASRSPKEIDFYGTDSNWVKGVYQVSINTLTLAIGDIGRERPVAFLSGIDPGSKQMMVTLKRVSSADEGWVPLFNGKNLTGWKPFPADRTSWKVENGLLVGHGKPSHLFTERGDFANFHLRMEARVKRVDRHGAFGVFVRTPLKDPGIILSPYDKEGLVTTLVPKLYGDNNPPPGAVIPTYRENAMVLCGEGDPGVKGHRPSVHRLSEDEWIKLEIIVDTEHSTTRCEVAPGVPFGSFEDTVHRSNDGASKGHIALQLLDDWSVVEFRKIEIKELPAPKPAIAPKPVLLKSFDPAKDRAVPLRGDAKRIVSIEDGAWRIENTFPESESGNFRVALGTITEGIPEDGILICRAKVKLQPKHKDTWGDLELGTESPSFHGYDWPRHLAEYRGEITEWTEKEVRYPAEVFRKKNPPTITVHVGLHGNGVLWVKDVELLHLPRTSTPTGKKNENPAANQPLRDLVSSTAKNRDTIRLRYEAGVASKLDLVLAEIELTEARIRLARENGDQAEVIGLHKVLVAHRKEERDLIAARVEAGVDAANELNKAVGRLADAEARLAKEKPPLPPAPMPRPKP